jgi:regulator of protease activity HflC (stomatin/prohibitin superfamily)
MFDMRRFLSYWGKLLGMTVPLALIALTLALLTEVFSNQAEVADRGYTFQFWLAVAVNLLPFLFVVLVVFWLAGRFLRVVYRLESWREGAGFLARSLFGQSGFRPWIKIQEGHVSHTTHNVLKSIGGPCHLVIYNTNAILFEKGGKLTKVEGSGFPVIEAFEQIYNIVDLRPKRAHCTVKAMTKEGILINWDVDIRYQIAGGGKQPTEDEPYPFSEDEVFRAATGQWVRETGRVQDLDWEGRVVSGTLPGTLRSILARRHLDQLIGLTQDDARAARESVQEELEQALRQSVPGLGAKILQVRLNNLKVDDEVTQQWIDHWQARWENVSSKQLAQGEATRIYLYETAKAEAQMRLMVNLTKALQEMDAGQEVTPTVVLWRLFSALDRAHLSAASRVFVPGQALDALEKMKRLLGSGDQSGGQSEGP